MVDVVPYQIIPEAFCGAKYKINDALGFEHRLQGHEGCLGKLEEQKCKDAINECQWHKVQAKR